MAIKAVFKGSVDYVQILNERGVADKKLESKIKLKKSELEFLYKSLVLTRVFDDKAVKLQRQGRLLTYAPCLGEEAISVGSAYALKKGDWVVPSYREQGMYVVRGLPLKYVLMYFMGLEEGNNTPEEFNITPFSIPVATHFPHAAGIGMAMNYLKKKNVVMAYTGDGGTSEGDFYEALNFAGVFNAPVVFVVRNNQWAISVPRKKQTKAETLAQKGIAAGINYAQVDGNDVLAVYYVCKNAADRARKGGGPTLIEAVSYRMSLHTTADDPTRYRTQKEVDAWKQKDPISRFRQYLKKKKIWNERFEKRVQQWAEDEVDEAVRLAESCKTNYKNMFKHVYKEMPEELREQMGYLASFVEGE